MSSSKAQVIRVGVSTIIALALVVGGIVWGKGGFSVDNRLVRVRFANAAGLDLGAAVTLNGVRKGSVTALDATPEGVTVTMLVENSFALKRDARAVLAMLELTGGKKIELIPGKADAVLPADAVIAGEVQPDVAALLADVEQIGSTVKVTLTRVDSVVASLNGLLGSREFNSGLKNTLNNLESSSGAVRELAVNNRAAIERVIHNVDATVGDLRTLVNQIRPGVQRALLSVDSISGDGRALLRKLQGSLANADSVIVRVDGIVADLRNGKGLAARLLNDAGFAAQIDSTVRALRLMIRNIDRRGVNLNIGFGSED